jgi:septal ring factor EnvC (AmiA/AmiB activator)
VSTAETSGLLAALTIIAGVLGALIGRAVSPPADNTQAQAALQNATTRQFQTLAAELRAELTRVHKDHDNLRAELERCQTQHAAAHAEIGRLQAQVSEMYRWARGHASGEIKSRDGDDPKSGTDVPRPV